MSETRYDIYFKGEILEGHNLISVKAHVGKLFQADADKLATLFSGKLILLKKDLDKATAAKYQAAMKKAGARILIKAKSVEQQQADSAAQAQQAEAAKAKAAEEYQEGLHLSPPGELLRPEERQVVQPVSVDVSNIELGTSDDATPLAPPQPAPPPAPDTSHLDVAEAGADLLVDKPQEIPMYVPDTSDISIAEAGALLQDEYEEVQLPDLDLSSFSLAEPGARIGEADKAPPPPPPDTSHIKLE